MILDLKRPYQDISSRSKPEFSSQIIKFGSFVEPKIDLDLQSIGFIHFCFKHMARNRPKKTLPGHPVQDRK